jgi:hypothetical protein
MSVALFEFAGTKYKIEISPMMAYKDLPDRFNINLLKMFADAQSNESAMQDIIMDDNNMLHLMFYFLEKNGTKLTFEDMLNAMENLTILDEFRDAFWAAIINFSPPLKKGIIRETWEQIKKEMKNPESIKNLFQESQKNLSDV